MAPIIASIEVARPAAEVFVIDPSTMSEWQQGCVRGHMDGATTRLLMNTLLVQNVLAEPEWAERLGDADLRGLTPLFWSNINPYGTFFLDMARRLNLPLPKLTSPSMP